MAGNVIKSDMDLCCVYPEYDIYSCPQITKHELMALSYNVLTLCCRFTRHRIYMVITFMECDR